MKGRAMLFFDFGDASVPASFYAVRKEQWFHGSFGSDCLSNIRAAGTALSFLQINKPNDSLFRVA